MTPSTLVDDLSWFVGKGRAEELVSKRLLATAPDGTIVCRSTLTNPNNGCVPVNLFGLGRYSSAAFDYLYGAYRLGVRASF